MAHKYQVPSLERLVYELKKWPGIGPRSAKRLAEWLLKVPKNEIQVLCQALEDIKNQVKKCENCFNLTEEVSICSLCQSSHRRKDLICVVEEPFDIEQMEASGKFKGQYHVLHGVLSPLNKVSPKDLTIAALLDKIKNRAVTEVILALDADMEGDMTALYLTKLIKTYPVKISRLAHGIPFGGDIDYIDEQTLGRALENRVEL